eukprot:SAG25_NODE_2471_length_1585_cov_0.905114_3_plen_23_part_01
MIINYATEVVLESGHQRLGLGVL